MSKREAYASIRAQLGSLLEDRPGFLSAMATATALLKENLDHVFWVGFYLPAGDGSLVVGPYQGPLASLRLAPGKGVCGAAASSRSTIVVPDVHAFPGHIACDPRSRSEICVPVVAAGRLRAVLDVDSAEPAAFDESDREGLEALAQALATVP